jgi:stress-induced morphogen
MSSRNRNGARARKRVDADARTIIDALEREYKPHHPRAEIEAYRRAPAILRARVIDPDFKGKGIVERENMVWPIIEALPQDVQDDLHVLLLLTPQERKRSIMSAEFDNPSPSLLDPK